MCFGGRYLHRCYLSTVGVVACLATYVIFGWAVARAASPGPCPDKLPTTYFFPCTATPAHTTYLWKLASPAATPAVRLMGFGFRNFRSPDVNKPMPPGHVRPGATLSGCSRELHVYLAFNGMRAGMPFSLTMRFPDGRVLTEHKRWRFTSEVTGRPIYPPRFHVGYGFYGPGMADGDYRFTVRLRDRVGLRQTMHVNSTCAPTAWFAPTAAMPTDGGVQVSFTDQSHSYRSSIVRRSWDFGDPGSGAADHATGTNPEHVYRDGGTYTVTLTVSDARGNTDRAAGRLTVGSGGGLSFQMEGSG